MAFFTAINLFSLGRRKENSQKRRLIQSIAVFRHGDRAPIEGYTSEEARKHFYRGLGELTDEGIKRAEELGKRLRTKTVDVGLLDPKMIGNEMKINSSPVNRCRMTVAAATSAIFNHTRHGIAIIPPIHYADPTDRVCRPDYDGGDITNELRRLVDLPPDGELKDAKVNWVTKYTEENAPRLKYWTLDDILNLHDEAEAGFDRFEDKELKEIVYSAFTHYVNFLSGTGKYYNEKIIRCSIGFLLNSIFKEMDTAIQMQKENMTSTKFITYSAHDTIVMPLLAALDLHVKLLKNGMSHFTASVLFELWMIDDLPHVKIFFYDGKFENGTDFEDFTAYVRGNKDEKNFFDLNELKMAMSQFVVTDPAQCGFSAK